MLVRPVLTADDCHPLAAVCTFWEFSADYTASVADSAFEKEAWLHTTLLQFGDCGFSIRGDMEVEATVLFCSRDLAPGAAKLPTAPVSEDAAIISSLFTKAYAVTQGHTAALLDAAIYNLTARDFAAVEAFGYRDHAEAEAFLGTKPARIGLLPFPTLEAAGFKVTQDHPVFPRLRLELPPVQGFFSLAAVEDFTREGASVEV